MNSLEAMKNAAYAINAVIRKEQPATVEIVNLHIAAGQLDKAIAAEEAQTPACWIQGFGGGPGNKGIYGWSDYPIGTKFYTRPAQPDTELLAGKLELMTTERDKMQLELGDLRALRALRPTNCGTGHCSCVDDDCKRAALMERSRIALQCLPDAPYKMMLAKLHDDMLAADAPTSDHVEGVKP
jgi:hypothetical protein